MINSPESLQQHLAAIVAGSDDAIITKDLNSIIQSWNRGAERLFGYTAEEIIGQPVTILIPDDRKSEEDDIIARLRSGERIENFETIRRKKDGTPVPVSLTVSPVRDASGNVIGASKIARDITLQRQVMDQNKVLLSEMQHRVRNSFAVASGLLSMCARETDSVGECVRLMRERLRAVSSAHSLAVSDPNRADVAATTLTDVISSVIGPFAGRDRATVDIEYVEVARSTLTPLSLIFYELCTNCVKYGGLQKADGRVSVTSERRGARLHIIWDEVCELEDPGSTPPAEGFGTRMIKNTLESTFSGTFTRTFSPKGMTAVLDVSLEKLTGDGSSQASEMLTTADH